MRNPTAAEADGSSTAPADATGAIRTSLVGLGLAVVVALAVGCSDVRDSNTQKTGSAAPAFIGAKPSETTETLTMNGPVVVREFTKIRDRDWYRLEGEQPRSIAATVAVSMKITFLDAKQNELGTSTFEVSEKGWQTGVESLEPATQFIVVEPLGDDVQGAYSLRLTPERPLPDPF